MFQESEVRDIWEILVDSEAEGEVTKETGDLMEDVAGNNGDITEGLLVGELIRTTVGDKDAPTIILKN